MYLRVNSYSCNCLLRCTNHWTLTVLIKPSMFTSTDETLAEQSKSSQRECVCVRSHSRVWVCDTERGRKRNVFKRRRKTNFIICMKIVVRLYDVNNYHNLILTHYDSQNKFKMCPHAVIEFIVYTVAYTINNSKFLTFLNWQLTRRLS